MKKLIPILLVVCTLMAICFTLLGCGNSPERLIIGTWAEETDDGGTAMHFHSDGWFDMRARAEFDTIRTTGTWRIDSNNILRIETLTLSTTDFYGNNEFLDTNQLQEDFDNLVVFNNWAGSEFGVGNNEWYVTQSYLYTGTSRMVRQREPYDINHIIYPRVIERDERLVGIWNNGQSTLRLYENGLGRWGSTSFRWFTQDGNIMRSDRYERRNNGWITFHYRNWDSSNYSLSSNEDLLTTNFGPVWNTQSMTWHRGEIPPPGSGQFVPMPPEWGLPSDSGANSVVPTPPEWVPMPPEWGLPPDSREVFP